jgi:hypothetical protein
MGLLLAHNHESHHTNRVHTITPPPICLSPLPHEMSKEPQTSLYNPPPPHAQKTNHTASKHLHIILAFQTICPGTLLLFFFLQSLPLDRNCTCVCGAFLMRSLGRGLLDNMNPSYVLLSLYILLTYTMGIHETTFTRVHVHVHLLPTSQQGNAPLRVVHLHRFHEIIQVLVPPPEKIVVR